MSDRIPGAFEEEFTRSTCAVQGALMVLPGRMRKVLRESSLIREFVVE
jgi:hypothetical protein